MSNFWYDILTMKTSTFRYVLLSVFAVSLLVLGYLFYLTVTMRPAAVVSPAETQPSVPSTAAVKPAADIAGEQGITSDTTVDAPLVGGDRDAHGCIGSAGYSWCEAKQKCLRPWEEACTASTAGGGAAGTSGLPN